MSEPKELSAEQYDRVIEAMKNIIDPEIGVNIVDLGLVYGLQESEDGALLIETTSGLRRYHSGEISLRAESQSRVHA